MKSTLIHISILKTLFFNFKYFPFKIAIKLPIIVSRETKLNKTKGEIRIEHPIKTGMIKIGFGNVPIFDKHRSRTVWNFGAGEMIFNGKCVFGHGSKIGCGGKMVFGNNFQITAESTIICNHRIEFGENVLISWHCQIMDSDFHKILVMNEQKNPDRAVIIGDHVWIGSHVIINKGVVLPDETIVAAGTIVTKKFFEKNTIIGGKTGKAIKSNVEWLI